ncbi:MAG: ABC transporter permease [Vicinamibacteria bacterium]
MRLEHWLYTVPLRLRSILRGRRVERELDEELQFHLDHKIEEGVAQGLSPEDARFRALRAMDGLEQRKEEARDARRVHWLTDFVDDVRYAVRSLRRTPGLTAFVVLTLALGSGMTTTPFSMVDALIFRPYPVPDPGRVVTLTGTSRDDAFEEFSYREYLDIRGATKSYEGVVASTGLTGVGFAADAAAMPRAKGGLLVSGNYFDVLGVRPQLGRTFRADEDEVPGRDAVVVLGPDLWKHELGSDPAVVGRTVRLNGTDFTVIGVAPDSFPGMLIFTRPDFYMPLAMRPVVAASAKKRFFEDRDDRVLWVTGRLKAEATLAEARSELSVLAKDFERAYPEVSRDRGAAVRTQFEVRTRADDVNWKFGVSFSLLALAVLLVACSNVAGLLLARARTRTREVAVRLALGAGRFRLIRLLLTESLMLAALGGLGGVAVGWAGIRYMQNFRIPSELPSTVPFRMDGRLLAVAIALSFLCALACGLAPALQGTRADLVNGLKAADVDEPGRRRLWGRNVLVVAQVAMSLMLLTASFLMARSFRDSVLQATGFAKDHLLMVRLDPRMARYDAARTQRFYEQLTERVRAVAGVRSVALTQNPPLGLAPFGQLTFVPDGFEMPRDRETFTAAMDRVDEGYFGTMGVAIVSGRGIRATDTADAPRVAVVNEQLAQHYWPGGDAVGRHLRLDGRTGPPVEIVGVARTIKYRDLSERPIDFAYVPLAQQPAARMVLLVKSDGDPLALVDPVKAVVRSLDPDLPLLETRSYEDLYRFSAVDGPRTAVEMVATMGIVGLLLAVAGLYGLVAYNVSRRTREIGIRMAIGARPSDVLRLMMGKGLVLVAVGTTIGLALGAAVEQLMNGALFNVGRVDLGAYLIVVPSMLLVTVLAAYVPARRAARIAPTLALRSE